MTAEATGAVPLSSLTSDSRGLVAFYCPEARFDYAVSGATAGTAAGFYPDGQAGWGQGELSWLNARNFPSIQAAIDSLPPAGGTVFLPAGLYTLTNTLYLPCDRPCHLIGEGRHESPARGTVLQWSTNVGMLKLRGDYSSVKSLTLRNTSGGQATREDQGYGIMIGRRNLNDPHPPPEPSTSPLQSEYLRGGRIPMHAVLIEDVTIQGAPGWAIHIPGFGKLSDEVTNEYDAVVPSPTEGGTLSLWVDLKRVRTVGSVRYGALFVGTGCTTTFFENCGFLVQGMGQVVNDTWYVYLAGCALPVFVRCTIEGQSPTTKPWVRMFGTVDPVFDCCWFENNGPSIPRDPTYFLNLAGGCRGGAIRHCRFVRDPNCNGHMSVLKIESGGAHGLQILNPGGESAEASWNPLQNQYQGPPHFDLGGDTNVGVVISGAGTFRDVATNRQLQIANAPRAGAFTGRALGRLTGTTTTELFNPASDDPAMRQEGNLIMNWDLPGTGSAIGVPMYKWGGTATDPKWRLVNNAPSLTQEERDARTNWVDGDMILLLTTVGTPVLQIRYQNAWKNIALS